MYQSDCSYISEVINLMEWGCSIQEFHRLIEAICNLSGDSYQLVGNTRISCGDNNIDLSSVREIQLFYSNNC